MKLVFDCEIVRCIPPKEVNVVDNPSEYLYRFGDGFEYCSGWDDFENMGISVVGLTDLDSDYSDAFILDMVKPDPIGPLCFNRLQSLFDKNQLFGFNSKAFDDNLCRAHGLNVLTSFDLLEEVRIAAYGSPLWEDQPEGFKYNLDAIAKANGLAKTGHGELAPKLWQKGQHQEVIDYCLNDVAITKKLILLFLQGLLVDPNTGKVLGV